MKLEINNRRNLENFQWIPIWEKNMKKNILYISESLGCTPETNTTL